MADHKFNGFFSASKTGKTGLTVTVDVRRAADGTLVANNQAATEVGGGLYRYTHTDATTGNYLAVFKTTDSTVDQQHVPALSLDEIARLVAGYLDAAITSRGTDAGMATALTTYGAAKPADIPSAATVAAAVWATGTRTLTSFGTLVADMTTAVWGAVSRTLTTAFPSAPSASDIDTQLTASHGSGSWQQGSAPTAGQVADAVWDEALSGHTIIGTAGKALGSVGASADPLQNTVPGSYASGTAGYALGRLASASITVTQPVLSTGMINLRYGDSYYSADGRALQWSSSGWQDLTGATVTMKCAGQTFNASVTGTSPQTITVELSTENIAAIGVGVRDYEIDAVLVNTHPVTLVASRVIVEAGQ